MEVSIIAIRRNTSATRLFVTFLFFITKPFFARKPYNFRETVKLLLGVDLVKGFMVGTKDKLF